jgi:MYXO-CTERM domain-containing protein
MPKAKPLLATVFVILVVVSFSGCIEQQDPPEEGKFTIEVESEVVFFLTEDGGTLHGAHAHVETELHHEHPEYNWTIGDKHYEGSEVELHENVGIRLASYDLEYYEEERHIPVYLFSLPTVDDTWAFFASGARLEEAQDGAEYPDLMFWNVSGLEPLPRKEPAVVSPFFWEAFKGANITEAGLVANFTLTSEAEESTTYVFAYHWVDGETHHQWTDSVKIRPGEVHQLRYTGSGVLDMTISNATNSTEVHFAGAFDDLPAKYSTHLGVLEWEGEVGPEEEAPGMTAWSGLLALTVVVLVASRRRR